MLPLASILAAMAIGFAGLVVDVRNGYVVRAVLQHAVDDGALSAQRWSAQASDTPGAGSADAIAGAVAEAMRVVEQELQSAGVAGISGTAAMVTGGRLTLISRAHVRTFFLPVFGIGSWLPQARADVSLWAPGKSTLSISGPVASTNQVGLWRFASGLPAGEGGGAAMAQGSPASASPDAPAPPDATSPDQAVAAGPCNCDAIVAGDPLTARDALDRMGVTPADPGPFQGDLTSAMGLGAMQAGADGGSSDSAGSAADGEW